MARKKKETLNQRILRHVPRFFLLFYFFLIIMAVGYKIYHDRTNQTHEVIIPIDDILAQFRMDSRVIMWDVFSSPDNTFYIRYPQNILQQANEEPFFAKSVVCSPSGTQVLTLEPAKFTKDTIPGVLYTDMIRITVHTETASDILSLKSWVTENCISLFRQIGTTPGVVPHDENSRNLFYITEKKDHFMKNDSYLIAHNSERVFILSSFISLLPDTEQKKEDYVTLSKTIFSTFSAPGLSVLSSFRMPEIIEKE